MPPLKVLAIHNRYLVQGGEDESHAAIVDLLRSHGHHVDEHLEDNRRIADLGTLQTAIRTVWSQESYQLTRRLIQAGRYDILQIQNTFPLVSPSVYYAAAAEGVPVVQVLPNYRLLCPGAYLYRSGRVCEDCVGKSIPIGAVQHGCYRDSRAASAVVASMLVVHRLLKTYRHRVSAYAALTEFGRRKFIEGGLPAERILVRPNCLRADPGMAHGGGGFALYVGRLSPEKGITNLLATWAKVAPEFELHIAGDGPLTPDVERAAASNPTIRFLGRLSGPQVMDAIGKADFLVFPSEWYEGLPRTIIEAFSRGTPVISAKLGAMESMVQHGHTGLHFSAGDAASLKAQIDYALANRRLWPRWRQNARAEFEDKYTRDRVYQATVALYKKAFESARVADDAQAAGRAG